MRQILFTIALFIIASSHSQNYEHIDKIVKDYPYFDNLDQVVLRVNNSFDRDEDKVRAYYIWMANNISYDIDKYHTIRPPQLNVIFDSKRINKSINNQNREKLINRVFNNQKGLCLGLSTLFEELCIKSHIESKVIEGITKVSISDINNSHYLKNHAWNAVKINNQWQLIDLSFSSGYENTLTGQWEKRLNDFYFFTNPEKLITTHLPADRNFQLINGFMSVESFFNQPIIYSKYFESGLELSNYQKGLITLTKDNKKIRINFSKARKNKLLYYKFANETYIKKLNLIQDKNNYVAIIDYKSNKGKILSFYYEKVKILDFKIVK